MVSGRKIGRTAHENVRDQARELAEAYRPVYENLDDPYCMNADVAPDDHLFVSHRQALGYLLAALSDFALTGEFGSKIDMKKFSMRDEAAMLKKEGLTRTQLIGVLMERHVASQSVVERTIRQKPKSGQPK